MQPVHGTIPYRQSPFQLHRKSLRPEDSLGPTSPSGSPKMLNGSTGRSPRGRRSIVGRTLFGKDSASRHSSEDLYQRVAGDNTSTTGSSHHDVQYIKSGGKQILSFLKDIGQSASATIARVPKRDGSAGHSETASQDGVHSQSEHTVRNPRFTLRKRSQDPQAYLEKGSVASEGLSTGNGATGVKPSHSKKIGPRPLQNAGSESELCSLLEQEVNTDFTPQDLDAKYRDRANAANVPAVSPVLEKPIKDGKEKDNRVGERGKNAITGEKSKHVLENIRLDAMTRRNKDKHRGKTQNTESPFNSLGHSLDPEGRAITFTKFKEDNNFELSKFKSWLEHEYSIEYYLAWKEIGDLIKPGQAIEEEKGISIVRKCSTYKSLIDERCTVRSVSS
ncbi:hypothetical protein SARC_06101 [Sphaeroforma arctica JP610]|uniref:Uncharacterized protein n=1 Tax=Sphaeroforma arctica JP610 TaxID=667725 RepID=A0A0L0FXP7_9EUKA|nr:hypothetical protein SARC_06101 [Sphaeroforma arctica JP610]KNC81582.1 hypothetical protein SARC_06101 [Sphaeroforma arctica JP610]|eukprot:XP_014155484.1 hypothetical protein SARC_06101 [Sphaeroforma arctica JP610]